MNEDSKFYIGIKALIINEKNEILLLRAGPEERKHTKIDFWDLPGGRIKANHDIENTLRREVKEELGISEEDIEIDDIFDATISNFRKLHGEDISLMLIVYRCRLPSIKEFRLSDEHSEWRWINIDEAKKLLGIKFAKSFVEKLDKLKNG